MTVEPVQRNGSMSSSSAEPSAKTSHIATARYEVHRLGQADERVPDRRQQRARLISEDGPEAVGREDQRRAPALRLDDGRRHAPPRRRSTDRRLIHNAPAEKVLERRAQERGVVDAPARQEVAPETCAHIGPTSIPIRSRRLAARAGGSARPGPGTGVARA